MTECTNQECHEEPCVQFDHNGKVVQYCMKDWLKWLAICTAAGWPVPVTYAPGTKTL